jgi:hypothetical protein
MRIPEEDLSADEAAHQPPKPEKKTADALTTKTATTSFVTGSGVEVK